MNAATLVRFEAKYEPEPMSGCWLWTGAVTFGYGLFRLDRKTLRAHRLSYEHWRGPIPAGLEPDHLCRVRSCVNPAHLEMVTRRVNALRGQGISAANAAKTTCPRGHRYDYIGPEGGRRCRRCQQAHWIQRYKTDPEFRRRVLSSNAARAAARRATNANQ